MAFTGRVDSQGGRVLWRSRYHHPYPDPQITMNKRGMLKVREQDGWQQYGFVLNAEKRR